MTTEQLKELEKLNERWANEHLETSADFNDLLTAVMDLIPDVLAHIKQLSAERDEEKAIVDRVWAALGISTYEQAKPLAIDEHVKRIIAKRDAALKALRESEELSRMQLCAVMTASSQNTESTIRSRIDRTSEFWTQAYADVCTAVDREMLERTDKEAALKACAEAKEVIYRMYHWEDDERSVSIDAAARHALSTDCGKGYHHDDEWKPVVEALKKLKDSLSCGCTSSSFIYACQKCRIKNEIINPTLAHAANLMKGEKE